MKNCNIDIIFNINTFSSTPRIVTQALLRREGSNVTGASIASSLILKINKEFKNLETIMMIVAKQTGSLRDFEQCIANSKGNAKYVLEGVKAEYCHAVTKDKSREYDYVDVIFDESADGKRFVKRFYLNDIQSELLTSGYFKPAHEFILKEYTEVTEDEEAEVVEG